MTAIGYKKQLGSPTMRCPVAFFVGCYRLFE
jgi:hypothetical protein